MVGVIGKKLEAISISWRSPSFPVRSLGYYSGLSREDLPFPSDGREYPVNRFDSTDVGWLVAMRRRLPLVCRVPSMM